MPSRWRTETAFRVGLDVRKARGPFVCGVVWRCVHDGGRMEGTPCPLGGGGWTARLFCVSVVEMQRLLECVGVYEVCVRDWSSSVDRGAVSLGIRGYTREDRDVL